MSVQHIHCMNQWISIFEGNCREFGSGVVGMWVEEAKPTKVAYMKSHSQQTIHTFLTHTYGFKVKILCWEREYIWLPGFNTRYVHMLHGRKNMILAIKWKVKTATLKPLYFKHILHVVSNLEVWKENFWENLALIWIFFLNLDFPKFQILQKVSISKIELYRFFRFFADLPKPHKNGPMW